MGYKTSLFCYLVCHHYFVPYKGKLGGLKPSYSVKKITWINKTSVTVARSLMISGYSVLVPILPRKYKNVCILKLKDDCKKKKILVWIIGYYEFFSWYLHIVYIFRIIWFTRVDRKYNGTYIQYLTLLLKVTTLTHLGNFTCIITNVLPTSTYPKDLNRIHPGNFRTIGTKKYRQPIQPEQKNLINTLLFRDCARSSVILCF